MLLCHVVLNCWNLHAENNVQISSNVKVQSKVSDYREKLYSSTRIGIRHGFIDIFILIPMIEGDKLSWELRDLSDRIWSDLEVVQFRSGQICCSKGVGFFPTNTFGYIQMFTFLVEGNCRKMKLNCFRAKWPTKGISLGFDFLLHSPTTHCLHRVRIKSNYLFYISITD